MNLCPVIDTRRIVLSAPLRVGGHRTTGQSGHRTDKPDKHPAQNQRHSTGNAPVPRRDGLAMEPQQGAVAVRAGGIGAQRDMACCFSAYAATWRTGHDKQQAMSCGGRVRKHAYLQRRWHPPTVPAPPRAKLPSEREPSSLTRPVCRALHISTGSRKSDKSE